MILFHSDRMLLSSVRSSDFPENDIRFSEWQRRQNLASQYCDVNRDKKSIKGAYQCLDSVKMFEQVRTGVTCSKEQRKRWKHFNEDTTCECGQAPETTKPISTMPITRTSLHFG